SVGPAKRLQPLAARQLDRARLGVAAARRLAPNLATLGRLLHPSGSAAAVGDDEVGGDAGEEPERQQPQTELAMPEPAHRVPDLADDVEDGASRDRVEQQLEGARVDIVSGDGAE